MMDKNGRLPLQLNIDTSFLYRDSLAPHLGIGKPPSIWINRPKGLVNLPPPDVTPTLTTHLPRQTVLNSNSGLLPTSINDASNVGGIKKSSPVKNDVYELEGNIKCNHNSYSLHYSCLRGNRQNRR